MLIVISPAKSLDFGQNYNCKKHTIPTFLKEIGNLTAFLKKLSVKDLEKLMKISPKLAELNFERFQNFSSDFNLSNAKPAILAFDGDVYEPIERNKFSEKDFEFAQNHLRILSGLYGILRPLDLIKPYRLEMGTDLKKFKFFENNLYDFWQDKIVDFFKKDSDEILINLASEEYFDAVNVKKIPQKVINISFKENKNGILKVIGINSKKARGLMVNFIIKNKITNYQDLKKFSEENYEFKKDLSNQENWVFAR